MIIKYLYSAEAEFKLGFPFSYSFDIPDEYKYKARTVISNVFNMGHSAGAFYLKFMFGGLYKQSIIDLAIDRCPIDWDFSSESIKKDLSLIYTGYVPIGYIPESLFKVCFSISPNAPPNI